MKALDKYQIYVTTLLMAGMLLGMQQDIFTIAEGVLGFLFGLAGFIHAGIRLILAD